MKTVTGGGAAAGYYPVSYRRYVNDLLPYLAVAQELLLASANVPGKTITCFVWRWDLLSPDEFLLASGIAETTFSLVIDIVVINPGGDITGDVTAGIYSVVR